MRMHPGCGRPLLLLPCVLLGAVLLAGMAGCGLFETRTPEPPMGEGGTYVQPDTPEQVLENIRTAVAEMNPANYVRTFAEDFAFVPATSAAVNNPSLLSWTLADERAYFTRLASRAQRVAGNELVLIDPVSSFSERRYVVDADYVLRVNHGEANVPTTVRGHLIWELVQGADGLWRLQRWTDRQAGDAASWSTLKAAFVK